MNRPDSSTAENRSSSSGMSGAYCALTSTSGIWSVTRASVASLAGSSAGRGLLGDAAFSLLHVAPSEPSDTRNDGPSDEVVGVPERVVEVLPVRACDVARAREREAPDGGAGERQDGVADERHLHHTRRNGDEGPDDGREAPEEHGPVLPAL